MTLAEADNIRRQKKEINSSKFTATGFGKSFGASPSIANLPTPPAPLPPSSYPPPPPLPPNEGSPPKPPGSQHGIDDMFDIDEELERNSGTPKMEKSEKMEEGLV